MNIEHVRQQTTEALALFTFLLVFLTTVFRPVFVSQELILTYIGMLNSALAIGFYIFIRRHPWRPSYAVWLIAIGLLALLPFLVTSGGVHSQFAVLLPLLPIVTCMIASERVAWLVTLSILATSLMMFYGAEYMTTLSVEQVSQSDRASRLLWLALACITGTLIGAHFLRTSVQLGQRLSEQATLDGLTRVENRRSILQSLDQVIEQAESAHEWVSVLLLDVDNFKAINSRYGHDSGDECLRLLARFLKHEVRSRDDLVGRYAGETFLLILQDVDQSMAHRIAEKLRANIQQTEFSLSHTQVSLSVTIGYCSWRGGHIPSKESVLHAADTALQVGKEHGRNQVVGAEESLVTELTLGPEARY